MASKNFSQALKTLRLKAGYTQKDVYEHFKIPQSTFSSWEVGKSEPSGEMLIKLCEFYKCDIMKEFSSLVDNDMFTLSELKLLENYKKLDPYGKDLVDTVISKELKRIEDMNKKTTKSNDEDIVYINFAQNTASAGSGDVLFGDIDDTPLALVENRITNKADFAVRVNGNSMLPNFSNGDIVLASKQPVDNGDIGLFVVNGNGYIKKKGSRELISLNPKFDNVQIGEYDTVYCMGKVIGKVEDEWRR